jgi:excisionase family DNA binding protein
MFLLLYDYLRLKGEEMPEMIRMMTIKEAAEFLGLNKRTVCRLATEGKVPGIKLEESWWFDMRVLEKLITKTRTSVSGKVSIGPTAQLPRG